MRNKKQDQQQRKTEQQAQTPEKKAMNSKHSLMQYTKNKTKYQIPHGKRLALILSKLKPYTREEHVS